MNRFRPRTIVLAWLAVALAVGWGIAGRYLYRAFIGLDPSAFPFGHLFEAIGMALLPPGGVTAAGVALAITILLALAVAGFFVARAAARRGRRSADLDRRRFLTGAASGGAAAVGSIAVGGAGAFANAWFGVGHDGHGWKRPAQEIFGAEVVKTDPIRRPEWNGSRIQAHRRLGRTDWEVSDIVLGTGAISGENGEQVARLAIERGVNYVDTAPDYSRRGSELAVGRALLEGPRDQIFLATKFCTTIGHLPPAHERRPYKEVVHRRVSPASAPTTSISSTSTPATRWID